MEPYSHPREETARKTVHTVLPASSTSAAAAAAFLLWVLAGPNGIPIFPLDAHPLFQTEEDCRDSADWLNQQMGRPYYRCVTVEEGA